MMARKKGKRKIYDQSQTGFLGTMGSGSTRVNYLQLNIPVSGLSNIGMVSEVPGSEKWPIRQLFQRDIDLERVQKEIMPYFLEPEYFKFFNPLTVAALPISDSGNLETSLSEEEVEPAEDYDQAVAVQGYYRLSYETADDPLGELAWSSSRVKLIAIDGQHRLCALKRLHAMHQQNPQDDRLVGVGFEQWSIPLVLVTLGHAAGEQTAARVLEKTRQIFVTINKQAKIPTRSRTILLNDQSVTAIACQETLDRSRQNGIPLAFFNWRDHRDEEYPEMTAYQMGVDELEDLLQWYLLGSDPDEDSASPVSLSDRQRESLFWSDKSRSVDESNLSEFTSAIRARYCETILPAVTKLLRECKPVSEYVQYLQGVEEEKKSDARAHAWSRIVYGTDYAPTVLDHEIKDQKKKILEGAETARRKLGPIFSRAVGPRGVVSAFMHFYDYYCADVEIVPWGRAADAFCENYNRLYEAGVVTAEEFQRNIVIDANDGIINYRLEHAQDAFGAAIAYAVLATYAQRGKHDLSELFGKFRKKVVAEARKQVRPSVKDEYAGRPSEEINQEVSKRAEANAKKQMNRILKRLEKNVVADTSEEEGSTGEVVR